VTSDAGAAERFEGQPSFVPMPGAVLAGYVGILLFAALMTMASASWTLIGPLTYEVPPLGPAAGVVLALELVRRAQWRSRRYVLTAERALVRVRLLGLLPPTVARAVDLAGGRLEASEAGPVVVGSRRVAFEALDPSTWDALAQAVSDAGGTVEPGFPPPRDASRRASRGVSLRLIVLALVVCAGVGAYSDWRARRERTQAAAFVARVGAVQGAVQRAIVSSKPVVAAQWQGRVQTDQGLSPDARKRALTIPPLIQHAGGRGGTADWSCTFELGVFTSSADGRVQMDARWVFLRLYRPSSLVVPSAPVVEVAGDDDPLAQLVLDALGAELDTLGIAHERVASIEPP
jgi:hypothetical protein